MHELEPLFLYMTLPSYLPSTGVADTLSLPLLLGGNIRPRDKPHLQSNRSTLHQEREKCGRGGGRGGGRSFSAWLSGFVRDLSLQRHERGPKIAAYCYTV